MTYLLIAAMKWETVVPKGQLPSPRGWASLQENHAILYLFGGHGYKFVHKIGYSDELFGYHISKLFYFFFSSLIRYQPLIHGNR